MSSDPRTRAYVERRLKEGRSKPEIIRILKRCVAREVFRAPPSRLTHSQQPAWPKNRLTPLGGCPENDPPASCWEPIPAPRGRDALAS